jgi:hypothetical protein
MAEPVVYAAVLGSVMASLSSLATHLVVFGSTLRRGDELREQGLVCGW